MEPRGFFSPNVLKRWSPHLLLTMLYFKSYIEPPFGILSVILWLCPKLHFLLGTHSQSELPKM